MPVLDFLGNLGAIAGGGVNMTNQLQQLRLRQLAEQHTLQQMQQQSQLFQQQQAEQAGIIRALRGGQAPGGIPGGLPMMAPQAPQITSPQPQQQPPPMMPQMPQANVGLQRLTDEIYNLESSRGANPATSPAGAVGPMQIMPATFKQYARPGENIYDPQANKAVGDRIVGDLYNRYGGDADLTAIAYNAGPGRADAVKAGAPTSLLPSETQKYLAKMHRDLSLSLPPQENAAGSAGAQQLMARMPMLPQFLPMADPQRVAQMIDNSNPGVSDEVKGAIFLKLFPLMSTQAKLRAADAWERYNAEFGQYKEGEHEREFGAQQREHTREFDIRQEELGEQRRFERGIKQEMVGIAKQRAAGGGSRAARFGTVDDLMERWRQEFVAKEGREPGYDEIADQHSRLASESKPSGQVAKNMVMRLGIGGNEVAKSLDAMTRLGPGATLGLFGGAQATLGAGLVENIKKNIANAVTPQSAQLLTSFSRGIERGLGTLASAGAAQGIQTFSERMKGEIPQENDTGLTILSKYANIREITEAAMEIVLTSDVLDKNKEQKAKLEQVLESVRSAVPFTRADIAELSINPTDENIAAFAAKLGVGRRSGQQESGAYRSADPDKIRAAVKAGKLTAEQGIRILTAEPQPSVPTR